ncbi:MAG: class I tRNA ligase family protein, partial [Lentisphaeria bacterium]|nr:class I tRNA ligase family protein [Lentisphaeria bacterium]
GEPFPIAHMEDGSIKLLEDELPVLLPELEDYAPSGTGESPLAKATDWLDYTDPETGMKGRRETNTMPQWAGSCWYYLRYIDPQNNGAGWASDKEKYWMPVDLYVGGAEHAVLHLLYARFWHKVLFDCGMVSTNEPFQRLINQGMILGLSYKDARGVLIPNDQVEEKDGAFFHKKTGEELTEFSAKMSKSLKNVVNPDEIIARYGADAFRLYEMFMGPLTAGKPWQTKGVDGVYRFLHRAWKMIVGVDGELSEAVADAPMSPELERVLHQTIKKLDEDTNSLDFNTGISQMMIFVNEFSRAKVRSREAMEAFVLLLAPYAPHIGEELWQVLGHEDTLVYEPFPSYDEAKTKADEKEILVQVLGKPKARLMMPADADPKAMEEIAMANAEVKAAIEGKRVIKVIAVPGRLVNIVAK